MLGDNAQELIDTVFRCSTVDRRLVRKLRESFDKPWRHAIADCDFPLPVQDGGIFQCLLSSIKSDTPTLEPLIRRMDIEFLAPEEA